MVTSIELLSVDKDTDDMVGGVLSYVQVYWVAVVLLFPAESVYILANTSMVVAPSALGINVAV